ncbi:hypothetical protein JXB01_03305 [Candidatus Micrarchaeota archaeon]|nr:hypothetical protein [Candidatus Micrarchaeota archaeon]
MDIKEEAEKQFRIHWKTGLFFLSFILFLATKNIIFAVATLILMLWLVFAEVEEGVRKRGIGHEIVDTAVSVIVVIVFWYGLIFILNTPTPVSAVVSCSMLPNMDRGDLVIVQGVGPSGYEIEVSSEELNSIMSPKTTVSRGSDSFTVYGSVYSFCAYTKNSICSDFILHPEEFKEMRGPLTFHYSKCTLNMKEDGKKYYEPCITEIEHNGISYPVNLSHDVIVYTPEGGTYFSLTGDIVHRVFLKIKSGDEIYYLTKGDNNQVMDIQIYDYYYNLGNLPVSDENYKGKVLLKLPYVGYLKLFISGMFNAPAQCGTVLSYPYLT